MDTNKEGKKWKPCIQCGKPFLSPRDPAAQDPPDDQPEPPALQAPAPDLSGGARPKARPTDAATDRGQVVNPARIYISLRRPFPEVNRAAPHAARGEDTPHISMPTKATSVCSQGQPSTFLDTAAAGAASASGRKNGREGQREEVLDPARVYVTLRQPHTGAARNTSHAGDEHVGYREAALRTVPEPVPQAAAHPSTSDTGAMGTTYVQGTKDNRQWRSRRKAKKSEPTPSLFVPSTSKWF